MSHDMSSFILTKTKLTTKKTNLTCFVCKIKSYFFVFQETYMKNKEFILFLLFERRVWRDVREALGCKGQIRITPSAGGGVYGM